MKTQWTVFSAAFALAGLILAVEAQAGGHAGGSFGGSRSGGSFSSQASSMRSSGQSFQSSSINSSALKTVSPTLAHHSGPVGPSKVSPLSNGGKISQPNNANKLLNANNVAKLGSINKPASQNLAKSLKPNKGINTAINSNFSKFYCGSWPKGKCFPGQNWWGFGWGCGWNYGYCNWWPSYYCWYQPCYYTPCYNICSYYYTPANICDLTAEPAVSLLPDAPLPAARFVRIVNPVETHTTLGFAVNGQSYSLEAGKTQELELNENIVVEFDRGVESHSGRYTLDEGVYQFASTPQGWELYRTNDAPLAVAAAD